MNLIIFAFALIFFNLSAPGSAGTETVDILPNFAGYLLLWFTLEKRRINPRMQGVYVAVSVMIPLSFLEFLSQFQELFLPSLIDDARNTGWILLDLILQGVTAIRTQFGGTVLTVAMLITAWFLFAMLGHWNQKQEYRKQRIVCKSGSTLSCGIGIFYLISDFLSLPFSPYLVTYPLSVLVLIAVWYSMQNVSEMETGIRN